MLPKIIKMSRSPDFVGGGGTSIIDGSGGRAAGQGTIFPVITTDSGYIFLRGECPPPGGRNSAYILIQVGGDPVQIADVRPADIQILVDDSPVRV